MTISTVARYARLLGLQLRLSLTLAAQYRTDFIATGLGSLAYTAFGLVPLFVVFGQRPAVAGWTFPEALVVMGWFTMLEGVHQGAINPSLILVGEHIRKGTLDFVLLKPVDTQFMVSTAKIDPWQGVDVLGGLVILVYAFARIGRAPGVRDVAAAGALLIVAALVLYSISILVVSAAFWVVRLDNLAYLFKSIFDAARWPIDVFRGALRIFFTFVIPLAIMTTYPARALLGRLDGRTAAGAVVGATAFAFLARRIWLRAMSRYTSASS